VYFGEHRYSFKCSPSVILMVVNEVDVAHTLESSKGNATKKRHQCIVQFSANNQLYNKRVNLGLLTILTTCSGRPEDHNGAFQVLWL
jgi:hypothetical protein